MTECGRVLKCSRERSNDIASVVAAATGLGTLIYAALDRHRPRSSPVPTVAIPSITTSRRRFIPWTLAAICCVAVAFNWYDQRLSSPNSARPLSPDDARLDIVSIQPVLDDNIKSLLLNYRYANNGKIAAIGELHQGAVIASQQPLYEELIDGMVTILRAQLFANKGEPTSKIQPGQSDRFLYYSACQ
jgi:hypothetical protein